jgi:hypothetical protein
MAVSTYRVQIVGAAVPPCGGVYTHTSVKKVAVFRGM